MKNEQQREIYDFVDLIEAFAKCKTEIIEEKKSSACRYEKKKLNSAFKLKFKCIFFEREIAIVFPKERRTFICI